MNREQDTDKLFSEALGYCREISYDTQWFNEVSPDTIAPQQFFEEYVFVVYACNFDATVLQDLWKPLRKAYGKWSTLDGTRKPGVLNIVDNDRKWEAVYRTALVMQGFGWNEFRRLCLDSIDSMTSLGFIGPVTKFHLARNLGFDVAKPDRWMCRIARRLGWESVNSMCQYLSKRYNMATKEVDIILWKYVSDVGFDKTDCTN